MTFALALVLVLVLVMAAPTDVRAAQSDPQRPVVRSIQVKEDCLVVWTQVPAGYGHAVLERNTSLDSADWEPLVAGALNGEGGLVTFQAHDPVPVQILRVRVGGDPSVPPALQSGAEVFRVQYGVTWEERKDDILGGDGSAEGGFVCHLTEEQKIGHVLNRIAYGPNARDSHHVETLGVADYIEEQLQPQQIDESDNAELNDQEARLFETYQPAESEALITAGEVWRYVKGTSEPPSAWKEVRFSDATWLEGRTGIGYDDDDDETVLEDMRYLESAPGVPRQPGYLTVYMRRTFSVPESMEIEDLVLRVDYDDGFVAYLNGTEVARANVEGIPPRHDRTAEDPHEAGTPEPFDLNSYVDLLRPGENVLAIQLHNVDLTSSDATMIPELVNRIPLATPPITRIKGVDELQQLIHVRGIYSRRQLQAVLGEFWENHFTTDYDKVAEYLEDLDNSDARPAMPEGQAEVEAAQMEYREYQFFYENALGYFGDLLLYSATSPAQLIYLDNVLNRKEEPNENYAREILELFAFGVDNRYTQTDIEQLAKCFTGWTIRKVWPQDRPVYPESARNPPTEKSVQVSDDLLLDVGPGWTYFKGTGEPTPDRDGSPTLDWTEPDFAETGWARGATSIGYGDDDDAIVLDDMRGRYVSVYLRRPFTIENPDAMEELLLEIEYDDSFVAYLNGVEVARSRNLRESGSPPPFDAVASANHEVDEPVEYYSLEEFGDLLRPAPEQNLLAIQVHNVDVNSSDLSIHPRLVDRHLLPGSIENGNPNGIWTFRFNPQEHDIGAKKLFAGTPHEIPIPSGRTGISGLRDALDVIDRMTSHPSTGEFICLKLINKFVSDEITLESYHEGSAPAGLHRLMEDAIAAWHSTDPAGHIETVMRTILDPEEQTNYFWANRVYRAKVKTPIEYINSSMRALNADTRGDDLPDRNEDMGMTLFTRDDPDGWSEIGSDWIDTGSLMERIKFAQELAGNRDSELQWDARTLLGRNRLESAESIIDYFDRQLFQSGLPPEHRRVLLEFVNSDDFGAALELDPADPDYWPRVEELVGLILSMPQWQYQ